MLRLSHFLRNPSENQENLKRTESLELEVTDLEVIDLEVIDPEVIDPEVIEPEVKDPKVIEKFPEIEKESTSPDIMMITPSMLET